MERVRELVMEGSMKRESMGVYLCYVHLISYHLFQLELRGNFTTLWGDDDSVVDDDDI